MAFDSLNYIRRGAGDSKGGGLFANVIQYGSELEPASSESGLIYLTSGPNEGAVLVATNGIYAVSFSTQSSSAYNCSIHVGTVSDVFRDEAVRNLCAVSPGASSGLAWTGFVRRGQFIWTRNTGAITSTDTPFSNQLSIAQVG